MTNNLPRWIYPGMRFKRWIVALLFGTLAFGLGCAYILLELVESSGEESLWWYLSLQFIGEGVRGPLLLVTGLGLVVFSLFQLSHSLRRALFPHADSSLFNLVYERQAQSDKPDVVIFASGIGMLLMVNAIKDMVSGVTVVLPMGEDVNLYRELLKANQLILKNVFVANIPNATICAEYDDGFVLEGFIAIKETRRPGAISKLFLRHRDPGKTDVPDNSELNRAIAEADVLLFGPASLFTGVIPSLLAEDVCQAIAKSPAAKVFLCNLMTEPGKTDGYSVSRHVNTLERQGDFSLDYVILNNKRVPFDLAKKYHISGAEQVLLDFDEFENTHLRVNLAHSSGETRMLNAAVLVQDDLISAAFQQNLDSEGGEEGKLVVRHDPEKLRKVFRRTFDIVTSLARG